MSTISSKKAMNCTGYGLDEDAAVVKKKVGLEILKRPSFEEGLKKACVELGLQPYYPVDAKEDSEALR